MQENHLKKQKRDLDYKIIITMHAQKMIDHIADYLMNELLNKEAANHFIVELDKVYDRLEDNPYQFSVSKDRNLSHKRYRIAVLSKMKYLCIFKINERKVIILGVFHQTELYKRKLLTYRM